MTGFRRVLFRSAAHHRRAQPSGANQAATTSVRRYRASQGRAAPVSQSTSFPPKASSRCVSPRASTREASTSCQGQGTVRSHEPTSCSGKAETRQYRPPWLSHPVGSNAGIGYRGSRRSFNVAPKIQGFVRSHRQPSAQASMQSNPAFEPTAPGVSRYTAWQQQFRRGLRLNATLDSNRSKRALRVCPKHFSDVSAHEAPLMRSHSFLGQ